MTTIYAVAIALIFGALRIQETEPQDHDQA